MDRTFRKLCRSEQMESDEDKLKWLRVRLVGKALTVYRRLGQSARSKYGAYKDALLSSFLSRQCKRPLHAYGRTAG